MSSQPPVRLWPDPDGLGPVTDVYELTMMAGYFAAGMENQGPHSSCSSESFRLVVPIWSLPGWSRPSATSSRSRSSPNKSKR